jgi:hypothetical protein
MGEERWPRQRIPNPVSVRNAADPLAFRGRCGARGLALEPPQINHQFIGGLVPVVRVFFERSSDYALQFLRGGGIQNPGGLGFAAQNFGNHRGGGFSSKRKASRGHFI